MNLLASTLYDPGTAVSKSTATLIAMTAFDTTNLRLAVTVPSHGMVFFRIRGTWRTAVGPEVTPGILLGVLDGATVKGRISPVFHPFSAADEARVPFFAEFTVTGLTPGSTNFDVAYGVEIADSFGDIKYGGPNNTTGNDAWGGFLFEAWDPQPLKLALDGGVNVTQLLGTAWLTPGTAGTPDVNAKLIAADATAATNAKNFWTNLITGTATAGGASTITLAVGSSASNDFYAKAVVRIVSGTGALQERKISSYVGSTRVATVDTAWVTNPDNTSVYQILGRIA